MDYKRARKGQTKNPHAHVYGSDSSSPIDIDDIEVPHDEGSSQQKIRGETKKPFYLLDESSSSSSSDDEDSADDTFNENSYLDDEYDSEDSSSSSEDLESSYEDLEDLEVDRYKNKGKAKVLETKKGKAKVLETDSDVVCYGSFDGIDNWDSLLKKFELEGANRVSEGKSVFELKNKAKKKKKSYSEPKKKRSHSELNITKDSEPQKKKKKIQCDSELHNRSYHTELNKNKSELELKKHKSVSEPEKKESNGAKSSPEAKNNNDSKLKKNGDLEPMKRKMVSEMNRKIDSVLNNISDHSESNKKSESELQKKESIDHENKSEPIKEANGKRKTETPLTSQRQRKKSKKMASKDCDFVRLVYNSDLNIDGNNDEKKELNKPTAPVVHNTLPLKFYFGEPKESVKSEFDIEVEDLFRELEFVKTSNQQEVEDVDDDVDDDNNEDEDNDAHNLEANMTKSQLCERGKHELRLNEEIGEICIYCNYIAREIRDIMPELIRLTYDAPDRERYNCNGFAGSIYDDPFLDSAENYRLFEEKSGTVWELLPVIHRSMYPHQIEGFEFLWKNLAGTMQVDEIAEKNSNDFGGCIVSHAPGTGKTRMTIAFISSYLKRFPTCHPVVVAPASMLLTWEEEFKKWKVEFPFYNLNSPELSGNESKVVLDVLRRSELRSETRARMAKIHSWDRNPGVLGLSYSLYTKYLGVGEDESTKNKKQENEFWVKTLLEKPGLMVLDEGHTPRAKGSVIFKALQKLQTRKRIILSGTPFQNNFEELENTLRIVQPDVADSLSQDPMFVEAKKRDSTIKKGAKWDHWLKEFNAYISPFVDVYKGSILQKTLPGLSKCMINLNPGEFQKKIIDGIESSHSLETECKATLVTIHPSLILDCKLSKLEDTLKLNFNKKLETYKLDPSKGVKTKFIERLVRLSVPLREKVLIFSQFKAPLHFIMNQLNKVFSWSEGSVVKIIQGNQDPKYRQQLINDFNDPDSKAKVMLASTKCCKEGISLTGASRVVLLDVVWNPSVEKQAISRAYRIGQKKMVYSYHLITATEVNKHNCQTEKDRLSELVFCPKENSSGILTNDESIDDAILVEMRSKLANMFGRIIYQINSPEDC